MLGRRAFDPYDPRNLEVRFQALARSFEASKKAFWDDAKIFEELMDRHGGIHMAAAEREALKQIFSIIYYGEIVALHVSAQLLPMVKHLDAQKVLAAQVIEEAKHVTAMQRYLVALGGEIPKVNFFARVVLEGVRKTESPTLKIFGMQLLVENLAHHLFREVRTHVSEPVLRDLLEYIDADEVKHVGLARNYLPYLLQQVGPLEYGRMLANIGFWILNLIVAAYQLKPAAQCLGIDMVKGARLATADHKKLVDGLGRPSWSLLARTFLHDDLVDWLSKFLYA
jgi:hypothetical protein